MATLADFRIFADLNSKDLEEFGGLIKRIRYRSEEIIFQEGAPAFGFYLIFSGRVKLVKRTLGGKKQILKILGPGEIVGETTLFDKGVHIAYAKTLEDSEVGFIERGDFFDFLTRHIPMIFRVFERFATEVKALQCKLTERSYNGSKERLARLILAVGEIGVELSRTELAEVAGVSSKTAIRTLGELEERGFIAVDERKVTILDRKSLGSLAEPFPITLDENLII